MTKIKRADTRGCPKLYNIRIGSLVGDLLVEVENEQIYEFIAYYERSSSES